MFKQIALVCVMTIFTALNVTSSVYAEEDPVLDKILVCPPVNPLLPPEKFSDELTVRKLFTLLQQEGDKQFQNFSSFTWYKDDAGLSCIKELNGVMCYKSDGEYAVMNLKFKDKNLSDAEYSAACYMLVTSTIKNLLPGGNIHSPRGRR